MKLSKKDKWVAVRWIDLQFLSDNQFPSKDDSVPSGVATARLKAWRSWRSLPAKWSYIEEWIDDNLSKRELEALQKYVERAEADD